jgi:hypothetical protein
MSEGKGGIPRGACERNGAMLRLAVFALLKRSLCQRLCKAPKLTHQEDFSKYPVPVDRSAFRHR